MTNGVLPVHLCCSNMDGQPCSGLYLRKRKTAHDDAEYGTCQLLKAQERIVMGDSEWPKCRPFAGRILRKPCERCTSVPEEQRCQNADGVRLESGWMLVTLPSGCSGTFPLESRRKGTFSRGAGSGGCSHGRTMSRERRTKRRQTMCLRRCQVFLVVRDNCGSCTDTEGSSCLLVELEGWTWWSS